MKEAKVIIQNKLGLHARPAAEFVKIAAQYKCDVIVSKNDREVNGKSIMGVMTLAAEMGSVLRIVANGADEELAVNALVELVNLKFNEE